MNDGRIKNIIARHQELFYRSAKTDFVPSSEKKTMEAPLKSPRTNQLPPSPLVPESRLIKASLGYDNFPHAVIGEIDFPPLAEGTSQTEVVAPSFQSRESCQPMGVI